jgi:hypothetical protein
MGIIDQTIQRKTAFFHSLGFVLTRAGNLIGNEIYKSAHNVRSNEIWVDNIPFAIDVTDAQTIASSESQVTMIGSPGSGAVLYPLRGSEYQTWFFDTGSPTPGFDGFDPSSGWVKPLINPSDVTDAEGSPSNGFKVVLYGSDGNVIIYNSSRYDVDYYSGLIKFEEDFTPKDSGFGGAATFTDVGFQGAVDKFDYNNTNGIKGLAFQYTGQYLDDYLLNLPTTNGGSSGGSEEWQSSVNGYLVHIGNNQTISGLTGINEQIDYLNANYSKYFVITDDDITGVGASWSGITATNSYYEFNGSTFSAYGLTPSDDENRFLLIENNLILETISISVTGSITENGTQSIIPDHIIEYTGTASTGLSFSAWQVTQPRTGMVTTLDNLSSSLVRYVGDITGWVEYQYEVTYKVNSQRDIIPITTTNNYDIAVNQTLQFEPSGDKSVDILVNGVEMPSERYIWGSPGATFSLTVNNNGTNTITVDNDSVIEVEKYLILNNGVNDYYRQIIATSSPNGTETLITYSGDNVAPISSALVFSITKRSNNVARRGDFLLWVGSPDWYELSSNDLVTFEYVTIDSGALNA